MTTLAGSQGPDAASVPAVPCVDCTHDYCRCAAMAGSAEGMTVRGHGYVIDVSGDGLRIDREGAEFDACLFVPLEELPRLGELVETAYNAGQEAGWWL